MKNVHASILSESISLSCSLLGHGKAPIKSVFSKNALLLKDSKENISEPVKNKEITILNSTSSSLFTTGSKQFQAVKRIHFEKGLGKPPDFTKNTGQKSATSSSSIKSLMTTFPHSSNECQKNEMIRLLENSTSKNPIFKNKVMRKALEIFCEKSLKTIPEKDACKFLGYLLFSLDHYPEELADILEEELPDEDRIVWLKEQFNKYLEKENHDLMEIMKKESKVFMLPSPLLVNTIIPLTIAKILITNQGKINIGIVDDIIEKFASEETKLNHDISIAYTLKLIQNNEDLRKKFGTINEPTSTKSPACDVIKSALGLEEHEKITAIHAKQTVLAALLSHLRQEESRSCFASFLAINLKRSSIIRCMDDFSSLLQDSHLTRKINGTNKDFPFLLKMGNKYLRSKIKVDPFGKVYLGYEKEGYIWESYGIQNACKIMGITPIKRQVRLALSKLVTEKEGAWITPEDLIIQLVKIKESEGLHRFEAVRMIHRGCFAYESSVCNPLLKVWVNTIAGMAENHATSFYGSCMIKTLLTVLNNSLLTIKSMSKKELETIERAVCLVLAKKIQFLYDPSISFEDQIAEGGFVLYDKKRTEDSLKLERIDSSEKFQKMIILAIDESLRIIESKTHSPEKKNWYYGIIIALKTYCLDKIFLNDIISAYHEQLTQYNLESEEYIRSLKTPWLNPLGHDAGQILSVYLEDEHALETKIIQPKDAEELIRNLIDGYKSIPEKEKEKFIENPYLLCPARITDYHAFSIMPGHSSFAPAWLDSINTKDWIQSNLIDPGLEIARSKISKRQRKAISREIKKLTTSNEIQNEISKILGPITIQKYRKKMIKIISSNNTEIHDPIPPTKIDQIILKTLSKRKTKALKNTLIHFADTNMTTGLHDLHFCFVLNPGSGKIEVWQARDDNSELIPIDQNEITNRHTWEIFVRVRKLFECRRESA